MEKTPARHNKWISYKIPPDWDGKKVEEVLRGPLALSNRMINRLTRCRGIRLNGRMPWLGRRVKKGDRLRVAVRPLERSDLVPEPVPFGLLYEDADLMVVDKPAGVNVHPVHPGETGTLTHEVRASKDGSAPCTGWTGTPQGFCSSPKTPTCTSCWTAS
jgi:23S rRNA pseudouridine1911/1915/1917 synthase